MNKFLVKHKFLFYLIQFTWGLLMNLVGMLVFFVLMIAGKKPKKFGNMFYIEIGTNWGGLELGTFALVCERHSTHLLQHEAGHGIQNLYWGPIYPIVIGIPSAIRYWYRELRYYRRGRVPKTDYDSIWFEGQASRWGEQHYPVK